MIAYMGQVPGAEPKGSGAYAYFMAPPPETEAEAKSIESLYKSYRRPAPSPEEVERWVTWSKTGEYPEQNNLKKLIVPAGIAAGLFGLLQFLQ